VTSEATQRIRRLSFLLYLEKNSDTA